MAPPSRGVRDDFRGPDGTGPPGRACVRSSWRSGWASRARRSPRLAPLEEASRADAAVNALLGEAALGANRPEEALKFFQRSLEASPSASGAHLGLGRAYLALGDYAAARIEFETVLRFDDLPPDLHQQVEIYAAAARRYAAGDRVLPVAYALVGVGNYRVNPTSGTDAFGGNDTNDVFLDTRAGGGLNYLLPGDYALVASLDLRYRVYLGDRRNDANLRWNAAASHTLGEHNLAVGLRGRFRTFGLGTDFRNDWGGYASWRYRLDADDQLSAGAEFRRRTYSDGPFYSEARDIVDATGTWTRSMLGGKASFSLAGEARGRVRDAGADRRQLGVLRRGPDAQLHARRPPGPLRVVRLAALPLRHRAPRPRPGGEVLGIVTRYDNLYEAGAGLTWEFARGWSLNPEVLFIRDQSNVLIVNYSSTEFWVTLRWDL